MKNNSFVRLLLVCGMLAPLIYISSDIIASTIWDGYSFISQTVSETRAVGAPTRAFLMPTLFVYALLEIAFGVGVWMVATKKRTLRITGGLLIGLGILDLMGPLFSLNLSQEVRSFTNTVHVVVTALTMLLLLLVIGFGAASRGMWFRIYSAATILTFFITGIWAFSDLTRVAAGLPTPLLGVRERLGIYGYMLWMLMFACTLLRTHRSIAKNPD